MAQQNIQSLVFSYFIVLILFSLFSHYNALKEDLNASCNNYNVEDEMAAGYDPGAYPSYFTAIEGGGMKLEDPMTVALRDDEVLGMKQRYGVALRWTETVVNVDDFGAYGDKNVDTEAFEKAWKKACSLNGAVILQVPEGKNYILKPVKFSGPCNSNLTIQILGNIMASDDRSDYNEDSRHWLLFQRVDNLLVEGHDGGVINGNGMIWWQNSCKINKNIPCKDAPTALTFYNSKNLVVRNLNIRDAQQIHVSFEKCTNVEASRFKITSPKISPNTDGIHITETKNIRITSSIIGTGDDCISIVNGSQNMQAMDITCGPGHGISIGSLGSKNSKAYVSGVTIDGAKLYGTANGVRIKTWQGGSGTASNIIFQNIEMYNVSNPIIIDQNYCDQSKPCKEQSSTVQVKDVLYNNINGTSSSEFAINFNCSKNHPCQGIVLQNVNLLQEQEHRPAKAICNNVILREGDNVFPQCP
ncbi:hypothetical protein ES319_D11G367800v1 [Gossypium barbadense]|uniref:endo-polygalacturonase n=2 Tax=Gossypium TaxID=3633 RepID=A0A5J5PJQ7_GOSBA|nr:hypothetical protein ES319_D11G367800v1 [Gossypium barbadense]TYG47975.1 hypothetical protein ES288_D11G386000v1 [Gossypium darwinii]